MFSNFFKKIQHVEFTSYIPQCGLGERQEDAAGPLAECPKTAHFAQSPTHWPHCRPLAENPRIAALDAATLAYRRPRHEAATRSPQILIREVPYSPVSRKSARQQKRILPLPPGQAWSRSWRSPSHRVSTHEHKKARDGKKPSQAQAHSLQGLTCYDLGALFPLSSFFSGVPDALA